MRRLAVIALAAFLLLGGIWVAPGASGASDATTASAQPGINESVGTDLTEADRGTSVQVETTAPPPTLYPEETGSGRRAIYSMSQQRVWVVEADGTLVREFLVSGRTDQPQVGTYKVWAWRSEYTYSAEHPSIHMRYMVRFTKGPNGGNIGFHEIPTDWSLPGRPWVQTEEQLGQPISDGCLRLRTSDAQFMWNWLKTGTTVVVIW